MLLAATPRTISINFGSGKGTVSGEYGIVPSSSWNNFSADKQTTAVNVTVSDGTTGVTAKWWSANIWGYGATDAALKGYLDDGACGDGTTGAGAHIAIMGIPFKYYDVIVYYATDNGGGFNPAAFKEWTEQSKCGDTSDSWDGTARAARNDATLKFGEVGQGTAEVGTNVSYLKRCFSFADLDIKGGSNSNGARGGIAAIQIVECDPHESEMYFNRQAGAVLIPAETYGTIALSNPIKATQYASQTKLPLTGSTLEIGGDAQYIQGPSTDTRTHSVSGWFRCDGLAGEKMLYAAIAYAGGYGGYKVVVDANGAINVGQCNYYDFRTDSTVLKSANGVIKADTWYYITVAVTKSPDARTATAKVFVNGTEISFPTGTFNTNLNGAKKTVEFSVGGGISVAGLYVDFSAIGAASLSQSLAVNPKYVSFKGTDYTAIISSESATFSSLTWDPAHPEPFGDKDALTVKVAEGVARTALNIDTSLTAGQLTVVSGVDFTLTQKAGTTVTIPAYDFAGVTGKLTLGVSPEGSTATFSQNPNVFFDCEYEGAPPVERGTLEYRDAALTWGTQIAGTWTLKSAQGDALTIETTANMRPTFNMDISGGSVTFDPEGKLATAWYGQNGTTTYRQTGGEVRFNVTGTGQAGTGNGLLLGYTGAGATPLVLDISGGLFAVENSSLNLYNALDMNVTGGRVRAKGVFAGGNGAHTIDVASGATFEIGSLGWRAKAATFTLGGTLKAYEGAVMENAITYTDGARLTAASGQYLLIKSVITGDGTITCGDTVDDGDVVFVGVEPPAGIAGPYYYGYEVTINDCGKYRIPEGKTWDEMRLFDPSGKKVPITKHDATYVYFKWEITDGSCWWDYEFEGNVNSTGTDSTTLSWDQPHPYQGNEYVTNEETGEKSLHIPSRPWRSVGSWPSTATFVMYGTMVSSNKTYQIGFGSTYTGSKYTIFLAMDDASKDTVNLCLSYEKNAPTVLCTMTVPNAKTSKHLYAFVLKTEGGKTVVNTYLDGELLQPYTHEAGVVTLGGGFQIGSGFGGVAAGYDNAKEGDPALLDWLRVYNLELNHEAMVEYAKLYPYEPANGSYRRAATSAVDVWDKDKAWRKSGTSMVTNTPAVGATVIIDTDSEISLDVNLSEDATYGAIEISGGGSLTIGHVPGYAGKVRSSGRVTVGANTTFSHAAFDMAGAPLTVEDGCTVTFDMSDVELDVWSPVAYDLTGLVTAGEDAKLVCTCGEVPTGRTTWYGIDPADQHFKFHVDVAGTLVAEVTTDTTFDALEWKVNGEAVEPNFEKTVYATISNLTEGATLTFDSNLDSQNSVLSFGGDKALNLVANEGVSVAGVSYDFRGMDAKATFKFNPDPSKVQAGYVRYDLDMGTYLYDAVLMTPGGRYEFKKIRIDGHDYDYHDRTVVVQPDDYLNLHDGSELGCGLSLDVRGGEVYMGTMAGTAYVAYGRNGTRFNQSGGIVTVNANGTEQTGLNGFVLSHSATGGGIHAFNITGGIFTVPNSSICFNQPTNTINVSGAGLLRAKGAYFSGKEEAAAGVINLSGEGVFEVGSLGVTADACTLNLNGGILRGYEAGAVFESHVVQKGATTFASTEGADLTMGGTFTGSSLVAISEGTVKLGVASGLGKGALTVGNGGTLDVNGFKPGNAITISGAGANGAGALANTGIEASIATTLTIAADATIGGTGPIKQVSSTSLKLNGHTLTISGRGVVFKLGGGTVSGGGQIVAGEKGTLASNGATSLGASGDLVIAEKGMLDLSAGNHISCRNFTNAGTITGSKAKLVVNGTLDASDETTLPILTLGDGATLKGGDSGILLTVTTTALTLGKTLNVTVEKVSQNIKLATIPADTPIDPSATALIVNGIADVYKLEQRGTSLLASSGGGNYAEVALSSVIGWTNFESLKIDGSLANMRVISAGQTNIDVLVTYESGVVTTQRFVYAGGPDGKFSYVVDGMRPGERYDVSAYVLIDTVSISEESTNVYAMTARTLSQWIDEDYQTFGGKRAGTGHWDDLSGIAAVKGEIIEFAAKARDQQLSFTATNRSQIAEMGAQKELRIQETFTGSAYCVGEEGPMVSSTNGLVAVTMATNALGRCQFAVVTSNGWQVVDLETFEPVRNVSYEIVVRIDESAGTIAYGVVQGRKIVWLVQEAPYDPKGESGVIQIVFTGSGKIKNVNGLCHDANLARVTMTGGVSQEYATIDEALEAAGEADAAIEPLWWSNYRVTGERGSFRVVDAKGYFEPIFAKWYHYEKTPGDVEDSYRYVAANNWIEYSDEKGVEKTANGEYRVMSAPGLAWIAEQAANGTFEGAVTLGADLDLSSKNWTPIANFTGSFDGKGREIAGLNNTNVVIDPLLGEAGHYFGGITNASGYTAYGLFGCTKDAAFRNITLRDVAISNTADSVAALVGAHAGGDLTIEDVTTEEGVVRGEGAVVAGLVTIGGEGDVIGEVVVTNNANYARVVGGEGANLAQVLAGTTWETLFEGTVDATGNAGSDEQPDMPICNFAAASDHYDEDGNFWTHVEANERDSVPIDPVNRTARMLAGYFDNGEANYMGQVMDAITASGNGATLALPETGATLDGWSTIFVDRNLTLDLNGNALYGVYDCDVFNLANGVAFTIRNGTVYSVENYQAFAGDTTGLTQENVTLVELKGSFYERTVPPSSLDVSDKKVRIVVPHSSELFTYTLESTASFADEWTEEETQFGTGSALTFEVPATGEQRFYRIRMGE